MGKIFCRACIVVLIFSCVVLSIPWLLPLYVNKHLIPSLKEQYRFGDFSGSLKSVGPTLMVAGPFSVSEGKKNGLFIDSVELHYSLRQVFIHRQIEKLVVCGLRLDLVRLGDSLVLKGGTLPGSLFGAPAAQEKSTGWNLPVGISEISVQQAQVTIFDGENVFRLPLSLQLQADRVKGLLPFSVYLSPFGQDISIQGTVDLSRKTVNIDAKSLTNLLHLEQFKDLSDYRFTGQTSLHAAITGGLAPPVLKDLHLEGELVEASVTGGGLKLRSIGQENIGKAFFSAGGEGANLQFSLPSIALLEPFPLLFRDIAGKISLHDKGISGDIEVTLAPLPQNIDDQSGAPSVFGSLLLSFNVYRDSSWKLTAATRDPKQGLLLKADEMPMQLFAEKVKVNLAGQGTSNDGTFTYEIILPFLRLSEGATSMSTADSRLSGRFRAKKTEKGIDAENSVTVHLPSVSLSSEYGSLTHAHLTLQGETRLDDSEVRSRGVLSIVKGRFEEPEKGIELSGITADIPWKFPLKAGLKAEREGKLTIGAINWQRKKLASLDGRVQLSNNGYLFNADLLSFSVPEAVVQVKGSLRPGDMASGMKVQAEMHMKKRLVQSVSLGELGMNTDALIDGEISMDGRVQFMDREIGAEAQFSIEKGTVSLPSREILARGLQTSLWFRHLPEMRSEPARLVFSDVALGDYLLGEGFLAFQLESAESLLIEKGSFKWCGGTVQVMAVRLSSAKKDLAANLFCDRLNLSDLLQQFGIRQVSGNGTVNGSIPVLFRDNKISFGDGFLYSTPGGGGNIKVRALERLSAGVPKESPQFKQLDFASAALANFHYNWVKLGISMEGDDVLLRMSMDGRPAEPLPFNYDQKLGTFNRLTASLQKGIDQPIVLDVNFRIPFNELLGYGKGVKQVLDLME
jgi:hypothetical protein